MSQNKRAAEAVIEAELVPEPAPVPTLDDEWESFKAKSDAEVEPEIRAYEAKHGIYDSRRRPQPADSSRWPKPR